MVLQREIDAKNRALKDLEAVKQQIAQILADKEAEKQALHDQMDQKLRLEWETRATLKINEIKEDLCKQFEQRVTEEVEKRLASLPSSQTNSLSSADIESSLPPRSSTPTEENYAGHSFDTAGTSEEDDLPSGTDLTSLYRRLSDRTAAETPLIPQIRPHALHTRPPMDIHMADPSPMSIASLSLSPRRTAVQEGSKLRQAPLSGGNIFAKAAMREPAVALFPPHEEADEEDDDDDDDDGEGDDGGADSRSPIQSRFSQDPFKVLEQPGLGGLRARPGLSRAKTSVPMGHARLHSTPSFAVPAPAAAAAAAVGHRKTPSAADQRRPSSPAARPGIPRALAVSPRRNAPAAPSQPSPTALRVRTAAAKTAKPTGAGAGAGKEDMVRAAHRNNMQGASAAAAAAGLQGKTLPELARSQEKASAGDNKPGANAFGAIRKENVPPLPPARWDPNEVDDMPSPFLKRNSRPVSALR
ncbi:G2-specific serine/threonine protein kinase [Taxawa tesnikishii (nom. ined.)]|nr:G2-specific serine/threonine protein kinase [Dothideales sp. JES 119]